jgi:hypothetical protein
LLHGQVDWPLPNHHVKHLRPTASLATSSDSQQCSRITCSLSQKLYRGLE